MQTRPLFYALFTYAGMMTLLVVVAIAINGARQSSFAIVFGIPAFAAMVRLPAQHDENPHLTTQVLAVAGVMLLSCAAYGIHWLAPEYLRTPWQGPLWTAAGCAIGISVLYFLDALSRRSKQV